MQVEYASIEKQRGELVEANTELAAKVDRLQQ